MHAQVRSLAIEVRDEHLSDWCGHRALMIDDAYRLEDKLIHGFGRSEIAVRYLVAACTMFGTRIVASAPTQEDICTSKIKCG